MYDLFVIPVAPIYHYSFTNSDDGVKCCICGQIFTYDDYELEKVAVYTKPYLASKILGYSGALSDEQILKCKVYAKEKL